MVIVLPLIAIITLVTIIPMLITPYRRPTSMVRNHILQVTPLGTSIEVVVDNIESRDGWDIRRTDFERGFIPGSVARPPLELNPNTTVIGEMSVWVNLGTYRVWYKWFPFMEWDVDVFWGFDADGGLIEVYVRKLGMF